MAVEWVDVSDIHLRDIQFHVTRADGRVSDFSEVVSEFKWTDHVNNAGAEALITCEGIVSDILKIGGEGSSAQITAPLIDLVTGRLVRTELWRGTFEEVVDNRMEGQIERFITAYDIAKLLATNSEDYVFQNSSLSSIFNTIVADFNIPRGTVANTVQGVGSVIHRGDSLWALFQQAVQRHKDLTGEVYHIFADKGRLNLRLQGEQDRWWVFETGESVSNVRRTRSLREMVNQVKVYGVFEGEADKPSVEATKANAESQRLYGLRQRVEYLSSAEDESNVLDIAQKTLDRFAAPDEVLEITGWIVPNLRAGEQIQYIDHDWGLNRLYYVESVNTTWSINRAETVATVRREAIDPGQILAEVTEA